VQFGKRIGFLESGGQDVDGIMEALENSTSFSTFAGLSSALSPILLAAYGNPVRGITAFSNKLHVERAESNDDSEVKSNGEDTFLQKLQHLRKSDPESYENHRLETVTLIGNVAAGSDTTSISLTGALYRIFTTKGVLQRLYEELGSQGAMTDEHISFDRAQQLPYLQMTIKEALRVHPVVGLPMWREINGAGLDIDGTHFPPGVSNPSPMPQRLFHQPQKLTPTQSILGINPWTAHRNRLVFGANATEFAPQRWDPKQTSPEKLAAMDAYNLSFGAGARTCIGRHISHLEMVKLIPEIVRRYEFEGLAEGGLTSCNRWFVKPDPVLCRVRRRVV
jgi:cytochrome P450